jgi:two-component system phosphate regulon sensor histidine kinase PhoR
MTSLSRDEEIIEEIYRSQLQSILFSINQYSDDIVRSWTSHLTSIIEIEASKEKLKKELAGLFSESQSVQSLYVSDSLFQSQLYAEFNAGSITLADNNRSLKELVQNNFDQLRRLYSYNKSGFRKIEAVNSSSTNRLFLIFILSGGKFSVLSIDKQLFIQKSISSKIQSVARDQFIVSIYDSLNNKQIYQTSQIDSEQRIIKKNLWLIPGYQLGIQLKGETIAGLVKKRTSSNLIIFLVFAGLMLITAFYAFRNIKREVELAQIKSDFVSNVSHELRTPLALISMFAETLEMRRVKTEEKKNEYYKIISQEAGRLSSIVNKILSFSQIEAGKRNYHFKEVELNRVIQSVADSYKFHLSNKGFEFILEQPDEKLMINADEEAVSEAVINLIDNAVKYSVEVKLVLLRLTRRNDNVIVEVEDKGIGIPKEEQQKIFEKFYRASKGLVHDTKGTGLGLSLVKHIMDSHKGSIEVDSEQGRGSTFRLLFPLK